MKNLRTIEWLEEHKNDEDLILFDCRFELGNPNYGDESYEKSHIKNAILVNVERDMTGKAGEHGGRHPLPNMNDFAQKMASLGVEDKNTVLIYDDGDLSAASRLWWMFKYIGKENVYVLEGGFKTWEEKGLEVTKEVPVPVPSKGLSIKINEDRICDVNYVKKNIGKKDIVIVDSRGEERYLGLVEPVDKKAGHIPSAVNYFFKDNFDNLRLKSLEELKERFKEIAGCKQQIVHCGSGITGCVNVVIMEELDLNPVLYLGSWSDWISYDENEIVCK